MTKATIIGWTISLAGTALWLYGYFTIGHPSLINWHVDAPHWIAIWLPNFEAEFGMALMLAGNIPIHWPHRR